MITSVGHDVDSCMSAFCAGGSGNAPLQAFDAARYRTVRAHEIRDRAGAADVTLRASGWLRAAILEAVGDAGLPDGGPLPVLVGTGLRELRSLELWWTGGHDFDVADLHFGAAARAALGARARPALTVSNACSASLFTLALATDMLALGEADAVVIAGADAITESMFGLLDRVSLQPPTEMRPFDVRRHGVLLGEGAAAVVLERAGAAARRRPRAWLRAVGVSCDACHETAPDRAGILRAVHDAHRRAGVSPGDVDLVMAHGTGTILNDEIEALVIGEVFGHGEGGPLVTALKSITGHTSGASGLMSLVTAVESMRTGLVPPTAGHKLPALAAEGMRLVVGQARPAHVRIAQVNAFGFGGVNAVAVVERAA